MNQLTNVIAMILVTSGANSIGGVRVNYDGRHRWYSAAVRRGRNRFSVGHFLDIAVRIVLHSRVSTSAGVLVCRSGTSLSAHDPLHVPVADSLLHHQPERRLVGNARNYPEKIEKGSSIWPLTSTKLHEIPPSNLTGKWENLKGKHFSTHFDLNLV